MKIAFVLSMLVFHTGNVLLAQEAYRWFSILLNGGVFALTWFAAAHDDDWMQ